MSRFGRIVIPDCPHHVTQRGNHRRPVFSAESEYEFYLKLVRENCYRYKLKLPGYCLMPNHVHHAAIPKSQNSLSRAIGRLHNDYARWKHMQQNLTGHLWQNRFFSCPMDEDHFWEALRYIELNPVRASLVKHAWDWPWSSARSHIRGVDETGLLDMDLWGKRFNSSQWKMFLEDGREEFESMRLATRTGRPLGSEEFLIHLEAITGRKLRKQKPGPKPGSKSKAQ